MARENIQSNRFKTAGDKLVKSGIQHNTESEELIEKKVKKKDKVITAKVYPETWELFTLINKEQGMSNNSVINMLVSEYVRNNKDIHARPGRTHTLCPVPSAYT